MRHLLAALLILTSLPTYAIDGYKPPDQFINPLIDDLLSEIKLLLDLKIPENRPEVYLTNKEQLMNAYCENKKSCGVAAVTDKDTGIIYLDAMMEFNNVYNASIFYHELVHYVQVKNNMFVGLSECERWAASEMHAYRAQSSWLEYHGARGFKVPDLSAQCH
jgi:hypothetical protein